MKKRLVSALAIISAFSITALNTASASKNYSVDDLKHLKNSILNTVDLNEIDDANSDNKVDSFDLISMKQSLESTGELKTSSYSATQENVKIIGRTLRKNDITWLVQSGSAVEFVLTGQSAEVTLSGDSSIHNDADYRSRYAVYVDDKLVIDSTLDTAEKKVTLFESEVSKTAKVKIIHLSEAMNGAIGVKDISVKSDSLIPIKPVAKKNLNIEFIGDSITCAYGVEGQNSYESFKTTTENFMKSYAYLAAEKLDADYSAVCYSGHGILSGYTSSGDKNTDSLIPDCYDLVGKTTDYALNWDFSSVQNDAVVINLGTNDSGYVSADLENRSEEFIDAYIDFLTTVREKNPQAYIICTLGTMGCEDVYLLIEDAVEKYTQTTDDDRIMSYQSTVQNSADGYGSDWHPSAITQQNSAYVLADRICQALGMESDQVGLDVAVDAVYDVVIDENKGGNAAFFVGYDKSFWINMVTGGTAPDAIEATLSGIGLKSGGTYRLEFDYTAADSTIPVLVRGESKVYYNDTITAGSDKEHYSAEFTVSSSDDNAEIVFQVGGKDYYNVTLSNIKLVKIA